MAGFQVTLRGRIWVTAEANLPANFGLARFINIRSKFLHSSLSSRASMGSNPYAANIPFLSSLYSDEHFGSRPSRDEEGLWFFYSQLFPGRKTCVIFCNNNCFRRIHADPDRQAEPFDLFLAPVTFR
jgi:hypothetical protein